MSNKSGTASQVISLPTGGGALQGIGETFAPDLFTGTGNFTVPIALPPGRNGFQPALHLVYSTGNGNGPFGLGWDLSVPGVSRKTSKGIPRYRDHADAPHERDTFILSGAEDLVPVTAQEHSITRFRPRTEGLFARIERVQTAGNDFWRVRSKDGLVSLYAAPVPGGGDPAVVADPAARRKIFCWKLSQTTDPFGNRIDYQYLRDRGSEGPHVWDQLYLHKVQYVDYETDGQIRYLVSVTFVYEERPDLFSNYRAGFEIRTRLRCKHIAIRTHAEQDRLTRTYELVYLDERVHAGTLPPTSLPLNGMSLLNQLRVVGHDGDLTEALPPLEFGYTRFAPERQHFQPMKAVNNALPPRSLAGDNFEMVGLFGNGLPDIVHMNGAVQFWRNLGNGLFDHPRTMNEVPAGVHLRDPGVQFADMNGDGRADLLVLHQSGYFPLSFQGRWSPQGFVQYPHAPSVTFDDNNIRLMDLDGDGVVDALRTGVRFELFFNDPVKGWETVETRPRRPLEVFPNLSFSDPRVKLADLTGDNLQDFVLVEQGRIAYWPYLGYGQWGRRVTMENSPVFRDVMPLPGGGFDPKRVLLGDLDGDGLDDILYIEPNRLTFWINQGGERWSDPATINNTPPLTDIDAVRLADMLGTGMAGVLWTFDQMTGTGSNFQFLDLTGGLKPYLLEQMDNHMGAVTRVQYASSTKFYLTDFEKPATRWKTPLPFPAQVVERVEVIDDISKGKLTTEYRYHHGYWDGAEREFRGFGMVEQCDTQTFERFHQPGLHGSERSFASVSPAQFSSPTLTKTWFHLGPVGDEFRERLEADFSSEYWSDDPPLFGRAQELEVLLGELPASERANAFRALRGQVLRSELYGLDETERAGRPYTVTETQYAVREESPPAASDERRQRIFFPYPVAQRTSQWERGGEPMTSFTLTDAYDQYGLPRKQIALAVPRHRDFRVAGQGAEPYLGTYTVTTYAQRDDEQRYMIDRVCNTTVSEIVNDGSQPLLVLHRDVLADTTGSRLRLFAQTFHYYDGQAFQGLPLRELGDFGALVRTETLSMTEQIVQEFLHSTETVGDLQELPPYLDHGGVPNWTEEYPQEFRQSMQRLAGYVFADGSDHRVRGYFVQTTRIAHDFHDPAVAKPRGLVRTMRGPLGDETVVDYDEFALMPNRVTNPAGLTTDAEYDYRVMQPRVVTDPNRNRTEYTFTPVGLLQECFFRGKGVTEGDQDRPSRRFEYDFMAFVNSPPDQRQPIFVRTIQHEHHDTETDVVPAERDAAIESVEYSDGFGRLLQTRTQAEGIRFGDGVFGGGVLPHSQGDPATMSDVVGLANSDANNPNVVVSGWQIYDNKGRVVEKFEPFFDQGFQHLTLAKAKETRREFFGQKVTMLYDPLGRVVRTLRPDGSEQRVIFGVPGTILNPNLTNPDFFEPTPWITFTYDENDLAPLSRSLGTNEPLTERAPRHHQFTPSSVLLDPIGRAVLSIERNRDASQDLNDPFPTIQEFLTVSTYDIRGNLLTVTDALGRLAFKNTYDLANNRLRVENIDAGIRRTILDAVGNEIERRDRKGALILQAYDVLQRPIRLWARDSTAEVVTLREQLVYGDGSNSGLTEAEARAANLLGTLHRHYDEAGLLEFEEYDFKGNVLQKSRRVIRDDAILQVFPDPTDRAADWNIRTFRVNWDPLEQQEAAQLDEKRYETAVTYDALNRVKTLHYPRDVFEQRKVLKPQYNRAGALESVTLNDEVFVKRVAYDAKGQRTLIALGNGVMTRYAYDPLTFQLLRLRSEGYSQPDPLTYRPVGDLLQDFAYEHDLVGNVLAIHDHAPGSGVSPQPDSLVRAFGYDAIYRLISATGRVHVPHGPSFPWEDQPKSQDITRTQGYTETYQYDKVGNMQRLRHTAQNGGNAGGVTRNFKLVDGTNRLRMLTVGNGITPPLFDYTYDDNGNLVSETSSRHFEWDHSDQMRAFYTQAGDAEPSVHAHYLYDAGGMRVKKLVRKQGGSIEIAIYIDDRFEHHHRQSNVQPAGQNNYVHVMDDHQRVSMVRVGPENPNERSPAVQFHLGDHLCSSNLIINQDGSFINREEYTPYGETSFGSFARKCYRFTGKERDEESGLYYHGARYYAPWLGCWTSADPAGFIDGTNLYRYVRNNPVVIVDPTGKQPAPAIAPPATSPETALERAAARWGGAGLVPKAGPAAGSVAANGAELTVGVAIGQAVAITIALYESTRLYMQRSGSIAKYGNPYGQPKEDIAFPVLRLLRNQRNQPLTSAPAPIPEPEPAPVPVPKPEPAPDDKKKPEKRETVNLDTGTIIAATAPGRPWLATGIHTYFADKELVATHAVLKEFKTGNFHAAGTTEKLLAVLFLLRVKPIPDDPSERVMNLRADSKSKQKILGPVDRIAFGTGDRLGITTVTGDEKFVKEAARQGVFLKVVVHPFARYTGD